MSFTFGCPRAPVFDELHERGAAVWVTITSAAEAATAEQAGADALVVQGTEAGGHRSAFVDDDDAAGTGLLALLRLVARTSELPLIATGGVADGPAVGSGAVRGRERRPDRHRVDAHTGGRHARRAARQPMTEPIPTRLTRAFSGRLARGLSNRFIDEHPDAPLAYPEIHHATSPLRSAARRNGDAGGFNLWAGQAHELAQARPAGEIVREIGADARRTLHKLAGR